jgi:2-succinyl-5-enolpyruvyl-6-hydroxy-3-cyclohexene-1-carboxylate synthase
MNITQAEQVLRELYARGVRELILCAGARNSPFISLLEKSEGFEIFSFFEERSAAFFALGRARRDERPVAVITTSGTAAAELLPATVEAFYSGVPLILVTADRPRRLRGTGAPQSIDQTGLFAKFVTAEFDLEKQNLNLQNWDGARPAHINICFDEPLIDQPLPTIDFSQGVSAPANLPSSFSKTELEKSLQALAAFLQGVSKPLVVIGTLENELDRQAVARALRLWKTPTYLEATSGLREECADLSLHAGDKILSWLLQSKGCDGVLRIGGIPTVRIWRDLEDPKTQIPVFSITRLPFAGLSDSQVACFPIAGFLDAFLQKHPAVVRAGHADALLQKDRDATQKLAGLVERYPLSEPAWLRKLSTLSCESDFVYLGNSLPIREWDLSAQIESTRWVRASRGVNGIDGQLSTFLGASYPDKNNWCVVGDLTALYDLSSPWALQFLEGMRTQFVIINNGGGKIFSRIFKSELFENRHQLDFSAWAWLWSIPYELWTDLPQAVPTTARTVIEIQPNDEQTRKFWVEYDAIWTTP